MMNRWEKSIRKIQFIIQIFISIILCFLLNGCIPKNIIDEIGIIHTTGIDEENGMFKSIVIFPNYMDDKKATMASVIAKDPGSLKTNLGYKSQYHVVLGQVQTIILGEKYSKLGISKVIESFGKDPVVSNVSFIVSETPLEEVMKPLLIKSPLYLTNVIEKGYKYDGLPETNLHSLASQYFGKGIDIYLPAINLDSEGELQINGLVIFKGDKAVIKITNKEGYILKALTERNMRGYYDFKVNKPNKKNNKSQNLVIKKEQKTNRENYENDFSIESLYGDHKINIINKENTKIAKINLELNIKIKSLPEWTSLSDEKEFNYLQKSMEKIFNNDIKKLLIKFQENEVDPIGLGIIDRSNSKSWNEKDFYKNIYPKMKFSIQTNIDISQSGVGD